MSDKGMRAIDKRYPAVFESHMLDHALEYIRLREKQLEPLATLSDSEERKLMELLDTPADYISVLEQHLWYQRAMEAWRKDRERQRREILYCLLGAPFVGISILFLLPYRSVEWIPFWALQWAGAIPILLGLIYLGERCNQPGNQYDLLNISRTTKECIGTQPLPNEDAGERIAVQA